MGHLMRELAPISKGVWETIDEEAKKALKLDLAARRLVDVEGPLGWKAAAVATGRVEPVDGSPNAEVCVLRRRALELVELWSPFALERSELDAAARGAKDADWSPVVRAGERIARAEDHAVFHGFDEGGIRGIVAASPHEALSISKSYGDYPNTVIEAMETLRNAGVDGPYGIALGPRCYAGLLKSTDPNGYPVLERLKKLVEGPIVRAPAVDGAVVLSLRGGDFELTLGEDFAVGYRSHDEKKVELYIVESMTFRPIAPEAAVHLVYR